MLSALAPLREATSASISAGGLIQSGAVMGLGYTTASGRPIVGPSRAAPSGRFDQMKIADSVAVITGGASGLGRATAERFLAGGGKVALLDLPTSAGVGVAKTLGSHAHFAPCDVTSAEQTTEALEAAAAKLGAIHVLVNCAGIGKADKTVGKRGAADLAGFSRVIQGNLIGTFNCIRLAAAHMAKNQPNAEGERGVVVNTASVAAFDGQIGQ